MQPNQPRASTWRQTQKTGCELDRPESEPNTYGVVCLNVDADGGELGVGSGQGDVGVGDDWAGGDMGVM